MLQQQDSYRRGADLYSMLVSGEIRESEMNLADTLALNGHLHRLIEAKSYFRDGVAEDHDADFAGGLERRRRQLGSWDKIWQLARDEKDSRNARFRPKSEQASKGTSQVSTRRSSGRFVNRQAKRWQTVKTAVAMIIELMALAGPRKGLSHAQYKILLCSMRKHVPRLRWRPGAFDNKVVHSHCDRSSGNNQHVQGWVLTHLNSSRLGNLPGRTV